jgi:hypothetical protein
VEPKLDPIEPPTPEPDIPVPVPEPPLGAGVGSSDIVPLIRLDVAALDEAVAPDVDGAPVMPAPLFSVSVPVSLESPLPAVAFKAPLVLVSNGEGDSAPVVTPPVVAPLDSPRLGVGSEPVVAGPRLVGVAIFDGSGSTGTLSAGPPVTGAPLLFSWTPCANAGVAPSIKTSAVAVRASSCLVMVLAPQVVPAAKRTSGPSVAIP